MEAEFRDSASQPAEFEAGHHVFDGLGRVVQRVSLPLESCSDERRTKLDQVKEELVGALRIDAVFVELIRREVAQVVGHDHLRSATYGRGEHVTIVNVRKYQRIDEVLVSGDETVGHTVTHQPPCPRQFVDERRLAPDNGVLHLVEDLFGPSTAKQSDLREPDQQVSLRGGVEDVRVEQSSERHPPWPLRASPRPRS